MELIKVLRKREYGKKGFTLVEVIVVIVIIAILAAIAVPSLTGYISKAKGKSAISEAKVVLTAVQSLAIEPYGNGATIYGNAYYNNQYRVKGEWQQPGTVYRGTWLSNIIELTGVKYTGQNFTDNNGTIIGFYFTGNKGPAIVQTFSYFTNDRKFRVDYNVNKNPTFSVKQN